MKRVLVLLTIAALLSGCGSLERQTGELTIRLGNNINANVIWPTESLEAGNCIISGLGTTGMATGVVFEETIAVGGTLTLELPPGDYNIDVEIWNTDAAPMLIATGTAVATVSLTEPESVTIPCFALGGDGELTIGLTWQPDVIDVPSAAVTMRPFSGPDVPVALVVGIGETASGAATLPAGWYTGLLRIYDAGVLNAGVARAVRIGSGMHTSWLEALTVNALTGTLEIDLLYNPGLPLHPTGSPVAGTYTAYRTIPSSFQCTGAPDKDAGSTLLYFWYLDGQITNVGVEAIYVFDGGPFNAGTRHYVSCIVVQSNGARAGELQYVVNVEEPDPAWMNVQGTIKNSAYTTGVPMTVKLLDAVSHAETDTLALEASLLTFVPYNLGGQPGGNYHLAIYIAPGGDFPAGKTVYWTGGSWTVNVGSASVIALPHAVGVVYNFTQDIEP